MGFIRRLLYSGDQWDSYTQGYGAQTDWEEQHENADDIPEEVVRHMARQQDEDAFVDGWSEASKDSDRIQKGFDLVNWLLGR